jgi:hypothetical protein
MALRATTIKVDPIIWKQAVQSSAKSAQAIVIDVSEPSENLSWEADYCIGNHRDKTIFIGNTASLRGALRAHLPHVNSIDQALGYELSNRRARHVFARNLRAALDNIAFVRLPRLRGTARSRVWGLTTAIVIYPLVFCLGFAMAGTPFLGGSFVDNMGLFPKMAIRMLYSRDLSYIAFGETSEILTMSPRAFLEYVREERKKAGLPDD